MTLPAAQESFPEIQSDLERLNETLLNTQSYYIEMMAAAYLRHTGLTPDQVVLIQQFNEGKFKWWFEKR